MSERPTIETGGQDYYRMTPPEQPTIRDHFAAAALPALAGCPEFLNEAINKERCKSKEEVCRHIARWSYLYADAMLAQRAVAEPAATRQENQS